MPDFEEERNSHKLTVEEIRSKLKEKGIAPTREWNEKPMYIDSSGMFSFLYNLINYINLCSTLSYLFLYVFFFKMLFSMLNLQSTSQF